MNEKELWKEYAEKAGISHENYQAWSFGVEADLLADLVKRGEKTATASAYLLYKMEDEPLPQVGAYNIILNSKNEAVCITKTTKVYVTPFNQVTEEHAFKEGEGDRSLSFWRETHKAFFSRCLAEIGQEFCETMDVVCEEFAVVYDNCLIV